MLGESDNRWRLGSLPGQVTAAKPGQFGSFPVGLGGKVERHQTVESAPYCEGHGGAVEQPVRVAALQVNGNAVRRLPGEQRQLRQQLSCPIATETHKRESSTFILARKQQRLVFGGRRNHLLKPFTSKPGEVNEGSQ